MISLTPILAGLAAIPLVFASLIAMPEVKARGPASIQSAPHLITGPYWNFPPVESWLTFDDMFGRNMNSMKSTGSTWDNIGRINVAIRECAKIGVDERVILGIIMQESHGKVGEDTTTSPGGLPTAGLMQCNGCPGFPGQFGLSQVSLFLPGE